MNERLSSAEKIQHAHPLLRRLTLVSDLSGNDISVLQNAQRNRMKLSAGTDLVRAGQPMTSTYVVQSGWIMLHCLFDDGRRQILALALPGDIVGEFAPYRRAANYNATALTDTEVAAVNPAQFMGLKSHSTALATALGSNSARDSAIFGDHIMRLGRLTAFERHCHLMLELWHRCHEVGEVTNGWIQWPLKQSDIADMLGLSLVHVNRTMMQLKREKLVTIDRRRMKIENVARMTEVSGFDPGRVTFKAA